MKQPTDNVVRISILENDKGIWLNVYKGKTRLHTSSADNIYSALEKFQALSEKYFPNHS